jgi:hypothetical protein
MSFSRATDRLFHVSRNAVFQDLWCGAEETAAVFSRILSYMLWIALSLFFIWCAYREIRASIVPPPGFDEPRPIYKPYLAIVLSLAALSAWPTIHRWYFEHYLSVMATLLADDHHAKVHCNTVLDTMLDPEMLAAGHANPKTGKIALQTPWCDRLSSYLRHPNRATDEELASLNMLTHESMHVRGELNEAVTECEAVQRNYRAARLMGVPDDVAKRNALDYYNNLYKRRAADGPLSASYYSPECAPGKALDEHLEDSTWATD